jgi:hypothetical protein
MDPMALLRSGKPLTAEVIVEHINKPRPTYILYDVEDLPNPYISVGESSINLAEFDAGIFWGL